MTNDLKFRAWDGEKMHYNVVPWQHDFVIDTMSHKCIQNTGSGVSGIGGKTAIMEVPAKRFLIIMIATSLISLNGKTAYIGDKILYQNTEGKTREAVLSYDEKEQCLMIGDIPYHILYNSAFIQPSNLEFTIIGNIYE